MSERRPERRPERHPAGRLVLAVDTATPAVTAAVVAVLAPPGPAVPRALSQPATAPAPAAAASTGPDRGTATAPGQPLVEVRSVRVTVDARRHGELLAPSISAVLAEARCSPAELAAIVVGVGPGPFTGLRVGLVTAAALADVLGLPTYGVCSLDGIAGALPGQQRLLVATDARRREVYWAAYAGGVRFAGPQVERPVELAGRLASLGVTAMSGAGARLYAAQLGLPLRGVDHPAPAALVAVAADRVLGGAASDLLTPLYLRRPDAVEPTAAKSVTPA